MQIQIRITSLFPRQKEIMTDIINSDCKFYTIKASRQSGKALDMESLLYYDGYIDKMKNVKVGDRIYGDDGNLTTVTGVYPQGIRHRYEIILDDGRSFICDENHLHQIYYHPSKNNMVVDTNFLIKKYKSKRGKAENCYIRTAKPVMYSETKHIIPPYTLGILIAEGSLANNGIAFTTGDEEIYEYVKEENNFKVNKLKTKFSYSILTGSIYPKEIKRFNLKVKSEFKHIPSEYLFDSYENRLNLLRGLMDGDGTIDNQGTMEYNTSSKQLSIDFANLVRSLGFKCKIKSRYPKYKLHNEIKTGLLSYRIRIFSNVSPFKLKRKSDRFKINPIFNHHYKTAIVDIKQLEDGPTQCITVDNKQNLFLTDGYTITHNSVMLEKCALYFSFKANNLISGFIMANQKQLKARFKSMMKWIPKELIVKANESAGNMEILFVNGSSIMFYTAGNPDSIASNSFDYMFCDEFALWPADAWSIIAPTVSAKQNAKVIIVSTPRGKNEFYTQYNMGKDSQYTRHRSYDMIYTDNPYYDIADVEEAEKKFSPMAFKQEYLAEFIFGTSQVFGEFKNNQKIDIWSYYQPKIRYFFGLDISGSGDDKTVLTIMNSDRKTVEIYEVKSTNVLEQLNELLIVLKKYKDISGYGEKNGLGDSLCDLLINAGVNLTKWITSNDSKQELVSHLLLKLNENKIELPTADLCPELDQQMSIYQVGRSTTGKLTYSHPSGGHDDYVISLMLANYAVTNLVTNGVTLDPQKAFWMNLPAGNEINGYRI